MVWLTEVKRSVRGNWFRIDSDSVRRSRPLFLACQNYVFTIDGVKQKLSLHKKVVTLKENQWGCDKAVARKKAQLSALSSYSFLWMAQGNAA